MKTWRELNAEARARGTFTETERALFESTDTCLVGERARVMPSDRDSEAGWWVRIAGENYKDGSRRQRLIRDALQRNDFDLIDAELDYYDDRMLTLKREG